MKYITLLLLTVMCFLGSKGHDLEINFNAERSHSDLMKDKAQTRFSSAVMLETLFALIKGTVVDDDGQPLSGVNVTITSNSKGTITDSKGIFSIEANPGDVLVFSFVGFTTREVKIGNGSANLKITLQRNQQSMDQVVVVGYGQVKRRDLTGSVSTVKASDIVKSTEISLNSALQGRAAGVQVTSSDGAPGADVSILVRAGSSISASNEPLYVIDGFPQLGGSNNNINPNDVESIEILKDASATAIYGSRGANGVIIITTKSGKAGKFSVGYDGYYSIQTLGLKRDLLNSLQYAEIQHGLGSSPRNSGVGDSTFYAWPTFKDSISTDWQDKVFRKAPMQNHNISFTGGTDNLKVSGSMGYTGQDGIAVGTSFKRYTGRLSSIAQVSKRVTNQTIINLSHTDQQGGSLTGGGGLTYSVVKASPFRPQGVELNNYLQILGGPGGSNGRDPFVDLDLNEIAMTNDRASFNTSFDITLMQDLVLKLAGGVNYTTYTGSNFYPFGSSNGRLVNGSGGQYGGTYIGLLNENTLSYKKNTGNHSFNALAGFTMQTATNTTQSYGSKDFPIQSMGYNNLGVGAKYGPPQTNKSNSGIMSYLTRVNYAFLDRYLFTGSIRADGSSKFQKQKWGYFPSVGLAWKIDQENFMKSVRAVSTFKIRGTWGETGNESVASYSSYTIYGALYPGYPVVIDDQIAVGFGPTQLGTQDLRWETTIASNLALDLGILDDRITVTAEIYKKKSKDLLLRAPMSQYSGFTTVLRNIGDIEVKGFEFNLNTLNISKGKFSWRTNFNAASNVSKVLKLNDGQTEFYIGQADRVGDAYVVKVGESLGSMFGYVYDGIFNTQEEIASAPEHVTLPVKIGTRGYKDISGPNGKPDGLVNSWDRTVIGHGNPKAFGGFNNEFRYGAFELSFLFTYSYGNDLLNSQKTLFEMPNYFQGGLTSSLVRWTSTTPQVNKARWDNNYNQEYNYGTSYLVEDGSYVRLKNIMFGYNLPVSKMKKAPVKSLKVYVSAQNLLTFTRYTGYDPEVNTLGSIITAGSDVGGYPRNKIYTAGINVAF